LKPRGYLKQTIASASKVYQPKSNTKVLLEPLTSQEGPIQLLFGETSSDKLEVRNPKTRVGFIQIKADKIPTSRSSEEYIFYPDLTPVGSPVYTSCKSKEPSPHFPVPFFSDFLSPNCKSPKSFSLHPEGTEKSLHIFEKPLYNLKVSSLKLSMVAAEEVVLEVVVQRWCRRRGRRSNTTPIS
jgi:hypothetical protein